MNESANNDTERFINVTTICYIGILQTIGLIGNSLVLYIYALRFKASPFNTFIIFLAIMDFGFCLLDMPLEIANMIGHTEFGGCKFVVLIGTVTALSTGQCLIAIAALRFHAVCRLLKQTISNKTARWLTIVFFCTACALSWPNTVILTNVHKNLGEGLFVTNCASSSDYENTVYPVIYSSFLFLIFLGTFISISILYCITGSRLWKRKRYGMSCRSRELDSSSSSDPTKSNMPQSKSLETIFSVCTDERKTSDSICNSDEMGSNEINQSPTHLTQPNIEAPSLYDLNTISVFEDPEQSKCIKSSSVQFRINQSSYIESHTSAIKQSSFIRSNSFPTKKAKCFRTNSFSVYQSNERLETDCSNRSDALIQYSCNEQSGTQNENLSYCQKRATNTEDEDKNVTNAYVETQGIENPNQSNVDHITQPPTSNIGQNLTYKNVNATNKKQMFTHKRVSVMSSLSSKGSNKLGPIKMLILMAMIFFVSYVPHLSLMICIESGVPIKLVPFSESIIGIIIRSYFLGSVCNPILYGCYNRKFRDEVKTIYKTFRSRLKR